MDAQFLKSKLTDKNIIQIINSLGGEIREDNEEYMIFTSITYDIDANNHKAKLYCYKSNYMFVEYHISMDTFDIFELIKERQKLLGNKYNFIDCMKFVCNIIGLDYKSNTQQTINTNDFINSNLKRFTSKSNKIEMQIFNDVILNKFEDVYHQSWVDDGISIETMKKYNIKYYDFGNQIIIPCYNQYNQLIGIRARNLDPNAGAKYIPYKDLDWRNGNNGWYKFNVGSTFYGLNYNVQAIQKTKKVIICESEKAVLQGDTFFGNNNIILGMYGSAMTRTKRDILLEIGVDEVIIAIDFDYEEESYSNQEEYEPLTDWEIYEKKVYKIADMFKGWCKVSVIIDYEPKHKKDCVTDYGKKEFIKLYKDRLKIYE
jgi:hypothetical protein